MDFPIASANSAVIHDARFNRWLHFRRPRELIILRSGESLCRILDEIERRVERDGIYAAGFVTYEASPAFDAALKVQEDASSLPVAWFGLYEGAEETALPPPSSDPEPPPPAWRAFIDPDRYDAALQKIKRCLEDGETYQVNFTFRMASSFPADPWEYFVRMIHAQQCRYGAFVRTDRWAVCSASPELFFDLVGDELLCRPMKGTSARRLTQRQDLEAAEALRRSEKERAENVMITDMVRNDMGRIAESGRVKVTRLFEVEKYPTVWQMTSSVRASTRAPLAEIFRALFPPASVTGAPKKRTMEIIAELEDSPRRLYTGAVGFIAPHRRAQFNVAIRTVVVDTAAGSAEYGVGSGIVWDSAPAAEYEECVAKTRVLTRRSPVFSLLETLLWTPAEGFFLLDQHLARLRDSAAYFSFPFDPDRLRRTLLSFGRRHASRPLKVRLLLSPQGIPECQGQPLVGETSPRPLRIALAKTPVDSSNVFLYHKTTCRDVYEEARRNNPAGDDVLLWNERGEATETGVANLVVELDGRKYTPPVECGLLGGVYRNWLLARGDIQERIIRLDELGRCARFYLINSVRRERPAVLETTCAGSGEKAAPRDGPAG